MYYSTDIGITSSEQNFIFLLKSSSGMGVFCLLWRRNKVNMFGIDMRDAERGEVLKFSAGALV